MLTEFVRLISSWDWLDSWIVITAGLAAMSCALPGAWLLLRRQSLLGDALSHSILPGIVLAYLALHQLEERGWIATDSGIRHLTLFLGAALSGIVSAIATELIQRWGRLDRGAAMGVVFTTMFALGLLLIRLFADKTHVDPGCVLYGSLETSAIIPLSAQIPVPRAAVINGVILLINGTLVLLFFKELRLTTFDPGLAAALGLRANWVQLALMTMTAATLVAAFESVGAILVIAMLIVPAATARMLTDRLGPMLLISLLLAAAAAALGHLCALTLPSMVFRRLGYPEVHDASTAGMMAVAAGMLFVLALLASPKHGTIRRMRDRIHLKVRIASEDLLGTLFRRDEKSSAEPPRSLSPDAESNSLTGPIGEGTIVTVIDDPGTGESPGPVIATVPRSTWIQWLARRNLQRRGLIEQTATLVQLTDKGRELAQSLVRAHRLWESYIARHFELSGDRLHATAEQVEHFLSPQLQTELATELDQPSVDPHGTTIPHPPSSSS